METGSLFHRIAYLLLSVIHIFFTGVLEDSTSINTQERCWGTFCLPSLALLTKTPVHGVFQVQRFSGVMETWFITAVTNAHTFSQLYASLYTFSFHISLSHAYAPLWFTTNHLCELLVLYWSASSAVRVFDCHVITVTVILCDWVGGLLALTQRFPICGARPPGMVLLVIWGGGGNFFPTGLINF
jgi:hypothetical protein